ncbi:MAG: hypothetical protein AMXMBFR7_09770 [Planctomycetota bacterium]
MSALPGMEHYPGASEIDAWCDDLWALAARTACTAGVLADSPGRFAYGVRHAKNAAYVKFVPEGPESLPPFHGYWQPAAAGPAPLLVHVPGYGAEMSAHPELVAQGFNVLHVSPLGYATPQGPDESKKKDGNWPVLPETARSGGREGYRHWLTEVILAVRWALEQEKVLKNRVSFFGTSQGGGTALLLGSLYKGRGARCVAADVPFLINFPLAYSKANQGAYGLIGKGLSDSPAPALAWRAIGTVDTLSHAHRLDLPVLLTAGEQDGTCPPDTIESLFAKLPGTKSYTLLKSQGHDYTGPFLQQAAAWFRLWA